MRHAAFGPVAASQTPMAHEKPCASRYPLTVAGTAADLGKESPSRTAFPIKPLLRGTGAIKVNRQEPIRGC
ncbi:exported hypothetical protein [Novosphingobium sp. KN65.2]|nr:exported hypothetical protein [Novosphingobium sp. KN65.2]